MNCKIVTDTQCNGRCCVGCSERDKKTCEDRCEDDSSGYRDQQRTESGEIPIHTMTMDGPVNIMSGILTRKIFGGYEHIFPAGGSINIPPWGGIKEWSNPLLGTIEFFKNAVGRLL